MTESGFVRVSSNHRIIEDARTLGEAARLLAQLRAVGGHASGPDTVSVAAHADEIAEGVHCSSAVTEAHLLLLTRSHDGLMATFDRGLHAMADRLGARAELIDAGVGGGARL